MILFTSIASGGGFLSTATKSMQKTPPKTNGFWISFCVQELHPNSRRNRELTYFYSRCRCIGSLKGIAVLPWQSVLPSDRRNISFTRAGAAAGLLLSQFPLRPIINEALERKGSFETIGFKRLFCLLFQLLGKVGRRRHKGKSYRKKHAVGTQKNHPKQRSAAQPQHSFALLMIAGFLALIDVLHLPVDLADGLAA